MSVHAAFPATLFGFPLIFTARTSALVSARWVRRVVMVLGIFCAMATVAYAFPITYTITGTGQGTLKGTPFGVGAPVPFTITAIGDTGAVIAVPPGTNWCNTITSATYSIPSIPAAGPITSALAITDVTGSSSINLGVGNCTSGLLWLPGGNAAFSTYALAANIGPLALVSSNTVNLGVNNPSVAGGGTLTFTSGTSATFQATVSPSVPIPTLGGYALLGLAVLIFVLGFAALRARRV
jgi:hypothetical protein